MNLPDVATDAELARQTTGGQLDSFEELVRRYEARIFRFLAARCHNEHDAQELAQATFVAAFRAIHQYRSEHPFSTWLFTIAHRKFLDHCRSSRPTLPLETAPEGWDCEDPAVLLVRSEGTRLLWEWVRRQLPPAQFEVVWLKYREEMSVKDMARTVRRTQTSVRVLLFRARRALLRAAPGWGNAPAKSDPPQTDEAPAPHSPLDHPGGARFESRRGGTRARRALASWIHSNPQLTAEQE